MEEKELDYTVDSFGNIIEIAGQLKGYNIINANDDLAVAKDKKKKQLEILAEMRAKKE
jgi:hypothetical protein